MMGRLPDPSSLLAPGSLCSATWPRLEARLTTPLQLRSTSQPALSLSVEHRVPLVCGTAPPQRFRLHPELATRTSDASCRGCERATSRPLAFRQNHPVTRPRQERGVDSSKRLPSTGARRSPFGDDEPATEVRSFAPAIRLPALFRISAAGHEMLDRSRLADAHHIRPRRATRRLSTSAIDPIHEHHRAPTELRRTSPTEARRRSSFSPLAGLSAAMGETADGNSPFGAQPAEMSRVRGLGSGQLPGAFTFVTAIARGIDFAPTRSARTPLVALRAARGVECPSRVAVPPDW